MSPKGITAQLLTESLFYQEACQRYEAIQQPKCSYLRKGHATSMSDTRPDPTEKKCNIKLMCLLRERTT